VRALSPAVLAAAAFVVGVPAAGATTIPLPKASFTLTGHLEALTAAGGSAAVATEKPGADCMITVTSFAGRRQITGPAACQAASRDGVSVISALWLGRQTIVAQAIDSPSVHGDRYSLWAGPRSGGPLTAYGAGWGWSDSDGDGPAGQGSIGCASTVAAGGGTIALASGPNLLGDRELGGPGVDSCLPVAGVSTHIAFVDGPAAGLDVPGAWSVLATDGKSVLLEALGDYGKPTGQLSLRSLDGTTSATPTVPAGIVTNAVRAWLVPEGLVMQSVNRVSAWLAGGGHWAVPNADDVAVAQGRVVYFKGRVLHVRRIADGADRQLLVLPRGSDGLLAAGSFGIAIATERRGFTSLYRVPWRSVI